MRQTRRVAGALAGIAALVTLALALCSCAVIDLSPFPLSTFPAAAEGVLPEAKSVWVEFPEPVDHVVAEPLLSVTGGGQAVTGDTSWETNRLVFTPVSPFAPGIRYTLKLQGAVRTTAGRTFTEDVIVPFYVGSDDPVPVISARTPPDGAVVGVAAPLTLTFSVPMDTARFRDAFSVSPSTAFTVTWSAGDTVAAVTPDVRWNTQALYTWTLAVGCRSKSGVTVGRAWTGSYLVQSDADSLQVLAPGRALVTGDVVTPLPGGLSDLLGGDSIVLTFSEDVDLSTLDGAFSLSPSVAGTLRKVLPGEFVFVPSADWVMGQEYVLTIGTELKDVAGNPLPIQYRQVFTPAIPPQAVTRIELVGSLTDSPVYQAAGGELNNTVPYVLHWTIGAPPDNGLFLTITLTFSESYDDAHQASLVNGIRLAGYFPGTVISPQVTGVNWIGQRTVAISFTGFARSNDSPSLERLYYKLTVPSGAVQSGNQFGSFLKDPVTLLLESGSNS